MTRFTAADVYAANASWGFSCGPAALAAICDLTLDEVRHLFGSDFRGYTNPTMMFTALRASGRKHHEIGPQPYAGPAIRPWPQWGICRIQWEGPWMAQNVPAGARYQRTHWVGTWQFIGNISGVRLTNVFDVNALNSDIPFGDGWMPAEWWVSVAVPHLTADIKRATGGWHITHAIEVERR
jgi:hypothetical protein